VEPIFAEGRPVARQGLYSAGGQGDRAASVLGLGRLQAKPRLCFFDAALDLRRAAVQVDIAPLEAQQFAAPHILGNELRNGGNLIHHMIL
jgi:hypothetical protein